VFESGNHPDVIFVSGTNKSSIGTDDVRTQIIQPMSVKPFRYKYKVFIVDNAGTLTPAAQNALLKTIEEPAPYGVFLFLTTHLQPILPTVLSRCVIHKLKPLPDATVQRALTGIPVEKAAFFAKLSQGSIGAARELAASESTAAMRALSMDVILKIREMDIVNVMTFFRRFEEWKDDIETLLDILYMCYSEAVIKNGAKAESADAVIRAKQALRQNGNFQLTMEMMLLTLGGRMNDHSRRTV
jgi:DNA polymerase-3 subunit delta'